MADVMAAGRVPSDVQGLACPELRLRSMQSEEVEDE